MEAVGVAATGRSYRTGLDAELIRLGETWARVRAAVLAPWFAERQVLREDAGEEPVLLLDDALTALDEGRQAYLLEQLRGVQALITVTTLAAVQGVVRDAAAYWVIGGRVESAHAHRA